MIFPPGRSSRGGLRTTVMIGDHSIREEAEAIAGVPLSVEAQLVDTGEMSGTDSDREAGHREAAECGHP